MQLYTHTHIHIHVRTRAHTVQLSTRTKPPFAMAPKVRTNNYVVRALEKALADAGVSLEHLERPKQSHAKANTGRAKIYQDTLVNLGFPVEKVTRIERCTPYFYHVPNRP